MTTETKPAWHVERPFGEQGVFVTDTATTGLVCKVWGDTPEQIEQRARLIAAAPELLEALTLALQLLGLIGPVAADAIDAAQAVLEKAGAQ